ncbi:MAG: glycerol-3-phosphate dehydrogenase/oxidase [marine benthic group bacterium]|nr:glycerol-3-phosphate dehydrogenase/oxidase [Candidatus Benthicola marisminoris]
MNREALLQRAADDREFDLLVVGGGATGLGVAVEAASRGYDTLLLEQADFAQGTSSRSTKLIHGGVRYLKQGNVSLVLEALHERGLLIRNAPHLVHHLGFVVPLYDWWEGPFYGIGLKVYDMMAGRLGLGPSENLSPAETLERIPTIEPEGLRGGVIYYDGQFDDSRLAITLARTADDLGAIALNHLRVTEIEHTDGLARAVRALDTLTGREHLFRARVIVNATGVFTDSIRGLDEPASAPIVRPSQGVHIVLDRSFLPGDSAIMVPETDDGRVLFAVPWHDRVIVGTTDTPVPEATLEPRPLDEEIEFLLTHAVRYLTKDPTPEDVLSCFAGLRPLVSAGRGEDTAELSRDHTVLVSPSGLVTITGGKWTTYRRMGEDCVNQAAQVAGLERRPSRTEELRLHGWSDDLDPSDPQSVYGSDIGSLRALIRSRPELDELVHPDLPYKRCEVVWAVREEMARRVEDVLARRTRALLLDARASVEAAPVVARLMAEELGRDRAWVETELAAYSELAGGYLLG